MGKIKELKKNSFVEGTIIATMSIFIVKILGMLYVIPFYAMIGGKGSALYAYAYNIYAIFLDISSAGLPIAISKIIKEYDTLGKIEAKERTYRLGRNIILSIALVIFTVLFIFAKPIATMIIGNLQGGNTIEDVTLAIRCVSISLLVVPFLSVTKGYLQGHNIIGVSSISQVLEQIVRIGVILAGTYVVLNILGLNVTVAVCVAVTGAFFGALAAQLYVVSRINKHKKIEEKKEIKPDTDITNKEIIKKIFSYAVPFIIIDTMFSLYNFFDMILIIRGMSFIGYTTADVEFVSSTISTWASKISVIIASIAMGMTTSLIPTIVSAYTLKNFKEVNNKLNQALQMIIMISLPMSIGLSLLSKPIWSVFYGMKGITNGYGYSILSIAVFVALAGNLFMITSSTLQSMNKFKLVYKSSFIGLIINILLDIPIIIIYDKLGLPAHLGASTASIIGYTTSVTYALYHLKKEHELHFGKTFELIKKLILPSTCMFIAVLLIETIIPTNLESKLSCIITIAASTIVGATIYLGSLYKTGTIKKVFGTQLYNRLLKKLHLTKLIEKEKVEE